MIKRCLLHIYNCLRPIIGENNKVLGISKRKILIRGNNNIIECYSRYIYSDVKIIMYGNNHHLLIEKDVIMKKGMFWFEDVGNMIIIRKKTSIEDAHFAACENGTSISIGEDCMLSSDIRIVTTDSHSIIDLSSGKRINPAKSIIIGNHVWIGTKVTINKGVSVGDNTVIASNSLVTKDLLPNSICGGIPARVLRQNIDWSRDRI